MAYLDRERTLCPQVSSFFGPCSGFSKKARCGAPFKENIPSPGGKGVQTGEIGNGCSGTWVTRYVTFRLILVIL